MRNASKTIKNGHRIDQKACGLLPLRAQGELHGLCAARARAPEAGRSGRRATRRLVEPRSHALFPIFPSFLSTFRHEFRWFESGRLVVRHMKSVRGSLADCGQALKLDPRLVAAICTQADVKRLQGDYKGAVSDASVALRRGS